MLSICIPNYNRKEKLERIVLQLIQQIEENNLYNDIEICVSDNKSEEDVIGLLDTISKEHCKVNIIFSQAEKNYGMDRNFIRAVNMAKGDYCWLIGNDDQVSIDGLSNIMNIIKNYKFDLLFMGLYAGDEAKECYPFEKKSDFKESFWSGDKGCEFFNRVISDLSIGGYMSNVIFRKESWMKYQYKYENKCGTTIIQVYIHLASILDNIKVVIYNKCIVRSGDSYSLPQDRVAVVNYLLQLYYAIVNLVPKKYQKQLIEKVVDWHSVNIVSRKYPDEEKMIEYRNLPLKRNKYMDKFFLKDEDIYEKLHGYKVAIFGASSYGEKVKKKLDENGINIVCFIDNDTQKWGCKKCEKEIVSLECALKMYLCNEIAIVVGSTYCLEIIDQINSSSEIEKLFIM